MSREIVVFGALAGALVLSAGVACIEWLGSPAALARFIEAHSIRSAASLLASGVGALGLFCSLQIYAVTGRPFWSFSRTGFRFMASAVWAGVAATHLGLTVAAETVVDSPRAAQAALALLLVGLTLARLASESGWLVHPHAHAWQVAFARSRRLLEGATLGPLSALRRRLLIGAGVMAPVLATFATLIGAPAPWATGIAAGALGLGVASDMLERSLFFRAEAMPAMPGAA